MNTNSGWRKNQIENQMTKFSYPWSLYPTDTNLTVDQINVIFEAYFSLLDALDLINGKYKNKDHLLKSEIQETIMKLDKEFPWIDPEPINFN